MSNHMIIDRLNILLPSWEEAVERFLREERSS